jgi:cyclophilin family peptidyl-prolyl cis-trans isomerase
MHPRLRAPALALVLSATLAITAASCGGDGEEPTAGTLPEGCESVEAPAAKEVDLRRPKGRLTLSGITADVDTSCGTFEIALDANSSPRTTASFVYLVEEGVYDGTLIHRIDPDFLIQGGDPTGAGTGGPGYFVDEPPPNDVSYTRGAVAMAKSPAEPPGRSGSQFFVVTVPDAGLPADFALLGEVTRGWEVVERIAELGDPESGEPTATVVIEEVTLNGV